jgi:hypothetical protein
MISQLQFTRRKNYDSTEDSICMSCFLTVARGSEATLEEAERNHDCQRSIRERCQQPSTKQPCHYPFNRRRRAAPEPSLLREDLLRPFI